MKKISYFFISLLAVAMTMTGCKKEPTPNPDGGDLKANDIIAAACNFYSTWEEERAIPTTVKVGDKDISIAAFSYAEAKELVAIALGIPANVSVPTLKMASNPERDSYDQGEIATVDGPKDGKGVPEDLSTLAMTFVSAAAEKGQIPNQTLVYRGSDAIAFSTNRMIVTVARAISEYAAANELPAKVSTEYLSASNTLKAFAQEFVKYYDIWENTICDNLSADASHNTGNGTAWERVHFIPLPYDEPNDYKNEGKDQYDFAKYGNPQNIEVNGETYTAANCWEIAIRGLMDMCTTDGQVFLNTMNRNTTINYGDGKSLMQAPISKPSEACHWGKYPWYESERDGGPVKFNGEPIESVGIDFILKCCSWHVVRGLINNQYNSALGAIGNFQQFGTDPTATLVMEGYEGLICPARELVILLRIYKYILDNNITKNVYTALKDQKFEFDFYRQTLPVSVKTTSLSFVAHPEGGQDIDFDAAEAWTAATEDSWIHIDKASGAAGDAQKITVTVDNSDSSEERAGKVTMTAGNYSKDITVKQGAYVPPTTGTLKAFAQEFVKALDVWNATVGTVDADGTHNGATAWTNVHLIPIEHTSDLDFKNQGNQYDDELYPTKFSVTVDGTTYTSAQCWEIAQRGMLDLVTKEGSAELVKFNDSRNHAMTLANGASFNEEIPVYSSGCKWGKNPWYEYDRTVTDGGNAVTSVGIDFMVKVGAWHVVRSFVKTDCNTPLGTIGNYQEFGTTSGTLNLGNYSGYIAPMREFLILARFYKYLLDNNIENNVYDAVKDQKFDFELYNQGAAPVEPTNTIKAFAKEYVKLLDVWTSTTGTVAKGAENYNEFTFDHENVHYIPMDSKIKVGDNEYDISDCLEIAMRSFMLLMGEDGNATNVHGTTSGVSNFPKLDTPATMSTTVPVSHHMNILMWYNETPGNGGPIRYNNEPNKVNSTILLNYCERNVNWVVKQGNSGWANVCGYNGNGNFPNHPEFTGCMIPARGQMAYIHAFKMLLDNNINDNVAAYFADKTIDCTLWGNEAYD